MDLENDFYLEVLSILNKHKVDFVLVGGLAVGFHGYPRYTGDMDLWLRPTKENMLKLSKALLDLRYDKETIDSIINSRPFDHPTPMRLFDDQEEFKVDLMTTILNDDLSYDLCFENAVKNNYKDIEMRIINIHHLISIKEKVKRLDNNLKDKVDAHELKKILEERNKNKSTN